MSDPPQHPAQRIDKWLWYARFFKTRSLAAKFVVGGKIRQDNGAATDRITKASQTVRVGDVLTFPLGLHIRVIKIILPGTRRGPAPEAQTLYEDLAPPQPRTAQDKIPSPGERDPGQGRPTKKERRALDRLRNDQD